MHSPCPFRPQHLTPSFLSIEKSLLATVFTFLFCLRICCALAIQIISSSLPIGLASTPQDTPSPVSRYHQSKACLEAKEYSSCQFIPAITLLIFLFFPKQYRKKVKYGNVLFIYVFTFNFTTETLVTHFIKRELIRITQSLF